MSQKEQSTAESGMNRMSCVDLCRLCMCLSHSDFGGFIESVDPVHEVLLIIGLQEELPHPRIDD